MLSASAYGLICAPLVLAWMFKSVPKQRKQLEPLLYWILAVTVYSFAYPAFLTWLGHPAPIKYDPLLFHMDDPFGNLLPYFLTGFVALLLTRDWGDFKGFWRAVLCGYAFVAPLYLLPHSSQPTVIPSMPMFLAVVMIWFARGPWRWIALLFALATAIGTVPAGEHSLINLVTAVPYSLFAIACAERRWRIALACLSVTDAAMLTIRLRA